MIKIIQTEQGNIQQITYIALVKLENVYNIVFRAQETSQGIQKWESEESCRGCTMAATGERQHFKTK